MADNPLWAGQILQMFKGFIVVDELTLVVCPYCKNPRSNFQLSVSKRVFHCWACNVSGSASRFLKDFGIDFDPEEAKPKNIKKSEQQDKIELPNNARLVSCEAKIAQMARRYLAGRGVKPSTIIDWDMRIGTGGDNSSVDWFGWTLVPLYGLEGLEYFCGLNPFFEAGKYRLPGGGKDRFVPKRRGETSQLVLVEGLFDGIAVWQYTRHDIFMLFGKFIQEQQLRAIAASNYDRVYVCLDADALREAAAGTAVLGRGRASLAMKLLRAGARPWLVRLPGDSDPDELAEKLPEVLEGALPFTEVDASRVRRELLNRSF